MKGDAGRREEAFQKSFAAEKNQGQLLNRKFDELLKQAKQNPDFEAPRHRSGLAGPHRTATVSESVNPARQFFVTVKPVTFTSVLCENRSP